LLSTDGRTTWYALHIIVASEENGHSPQNWLPSKETNCKSTVIMDHPAWRREITLLLNRFMPRVRLRFAEGKQNKYVFV